jgi:CheY-like chemotaxis protein
MKVTAVADQNQPALSSTDDARPLVLAIDDENDILDVVRLTLEGEGFRVQTALTPQEGIKYFEAHRREVNVVLLDFLMPEMTGDVVFECLQQINPDVPVILLTGCDDHVAKRLFANGLRAYLQKPFYLDDLITAVRNEVERV